MPSDKRQQYTSKGCETTAELLVSIAVEQSLGVRCEDVEQAVIRYEETLHENMEFARCTEQLANMMQHLIGASQARVSKEEFLRLLQHLVASNNRMKSFSKSLHEDYKSKSLSI